MTDGDKLLMLKAITGESDEEILLAYLKIAAQKVLVRLYPFATEDKEVPTKYATHQVQIAAYYLNKRGAEGEVSHSENGISRSYEDGDVPPSLLKDIIPVASVIERVAENEITVP